MTAPVAPVTPAPTTLAALSLFLATPAQVDVARTRNHPFWGRGLDLNAYLARADAVDTYEHAADGNLATWVLAPRDDPLTLDFFCACETFRRRALVVAKDSEDTFAYGIAAVFCPPQHRGRGYARHMMRLLHHVLAPPTRLPPFPPQWGAPPVPPPGVANARFSALWSDVGPDFYTTCGPAPDAPGWFVHDPISTIWPVPSSPPPPPPHAKYLSEDDCLALWDDDAKYIAARLHEPAVPGTAARCTFLPDHGMAAYQLRRMRFFRPGTPGVPLPDSWGVRVGPAYATYVTYIRRGPPHGPHALVVTRLRATAAELPALLAALMHAARKHGTESVEVWNVPAELLDTAHALGASTAPRAPEQHLPAIAWYGPEDPAHVEWMFNEKFCWC